MEKELGVRSTYCKDLIAVLKNFNKIDPTLTGLKHSEKIKGF